MKLGTKDSRFGKAGVSLVTVLLFMLVATIAATATFKWLTSENRSSGARLKKQEAYQSAMAGIENTRAWMTYNANDVGALITQFQSEGKMIKLNNRLTPWLRANQNYDVWLTGVNTGTAHNFKLKILASGKSSNNTVHNEVAIFNVDGLYKVQIPQEAVGINFDKAFDGKMTGITGNDTLQSGIIHGDFSDQNNTPKLTGNFVVSGDMGFGGTVHGDGDMFVKGSITSKNGGYTFGTKIYNPPWSNKLDTNVVFVGGDIACADNQPIRVYGDLYVGGSISAKCAIDVSGNLTIGGSIERTDNAAKTFTVGRNLVFKKDAVFHWTTEIEYGTGGPAGTGVGVNTYLAKLNGKNSNGNRKINLGKKVYLYSNPGYVGCPNKDEPGGFRPANCTYCEGIFTQCSGPNGEGSVVANRYFSIYNPLSGAGMGGPGIGPGMGGPGGGPGMGGPGGANNYTARIQSEFITEWAKTDNILGAVSDKYWDNIAKMNAYGNIIKNDGTIPQALLLKDSASWIAKAKATNTRCGIGQKWAMDAATVKKLSDCYQANKDNPDVLYNGFLAVEWQFDQDKDPGDQKLDGKFLIYASTVIGNTVLPATTENSVVMFYFARGANGQLKGAHKQHKSWVYNYFIYSNADIKEIWNFNIKGSIVMSNGSTLQKYQGDNKIEFKSAVIQALADAGIIKENPEFTSLAGNANPAAGGINAAAGHVYDSYFIAAAPQLNITLESQYENNEPLPTAASEQNISPSFIVLPRVIYLPKDPYGRLSDYFNVVNLNGSALTKNIANVGGCADIPKNTLLYDRAAANPTVLPAGLHTCQYTADNGAVIPFYVFVSNDELGNKPPVSFEKSYQDMGANSTEDVKLKCEVGSGEEFTVKVSKPTDLPAGNVWQITTQATPDGPCDATSSSCKFKLHFNEADCGSPKSLFRVTTNGATEGTYTFQLLECTGCQIASPSAEVLQVASSVTVVRHDLAEYCNLTGVTCEGDLLAQSNTNQWPDCNVDGIGNWVNAVGFNSDVTNNCSITSENDMWGCGATSDIKLELTGSGIPNSCEAVIPESERNVLRQANLTTGQSYELYGSLKAKRVTFHVGFAGDNLAGKNIIVSSNRFTTDQNCSYTAAGCNFNVFAGDEVTVTVTGSSKADFSYWKCNEGSSNCYENEVFSSATYTINAMNGDNSITAWFGQKDKHCFFDEFQTTKECTGVGDEWQYCFNYCSTEGDCKIGNGALCDQAKWIVLGPSSLRSLLQYSDGKIWLDRSYNRHKKQDDVEALKVMSTVQAGFYGTLRAQFQVPRLGRESDETSARVNKSGFLLGSNDDATFYIMLNVYANKDGKLTAKVCIDGSCRTELLTHLGSSVSVTSTDVVTLTADVKRENSRDVLLVDVVKGGYGNYTTASARFILSELDGFYGLSGTVNEYVGISLADPDFKVYDAGWKSETYNAECWNTYPTVKCSFRAAYLGGIVPLAESARPWVGLSSWFDEKGCEPQYFYNGDDACGNYANADGYKECVATEYYKFTNGGVHGTVETQTSGTQQTIIETDMAKVKIKECHNTYLSQDDRALLYAEEARCGEFWVGAVNPCTQNHKFFPVSSTAVETSRSISTHVDSDTPSEYSSNELFAVDANTVVNLRSALIRITMENTGGSELEVYLRSQTTTGYYNTTIAYSTSAVTTAATTATFSVEELANNSGFDPEHVTGVIIRNHGTSAVVIKEIRSVCDNVASIQCKDAEYANGKFRVNTTVKHAVGIQSYTVAGTENGESESGLSKTICSSGEGCPASDALGRLALETDAYNPYAAPFDDSKTYVFTVHMLGSDQADVEGSPCTTPPLVLYPISGECKWSSTNTKPSVQQGKGLPDFQYKLADCAGGNCAWEIVLDDVSTKLHEGTGTVGGFSSLSIDTRTAHNTETSTLETGDHKIYFKNKSDATTKFNECFATFEVVDASSGTGNLTCSMPSQVIPGTQINSLSIYSSLSAQNFDVYFNGTKGYSGLYVNNGQNSFNYVSAPNTIGTYTYKITKQGQTEAECSGSIEVVNPLVCSIKDEVKLNVQNTFQVSTLSGFTCNNCSYSNNLSCGSNCGNTVGNKNFTMTSATPLTLSVTCQCSNKEMSCSQTAVSEVVAPDVDCSGTIDAEPSANVSFTPTKLTGCEGGCKYWIKNSSGDLVKDSTNITSASSISFSASATASTTYTLHVKNSKGTDNCSITVDYKKPAFTCPADMEKAVGSDVTVTPTNVQYCTKGCSYTITGGTFTDNSTSGANYTSGALPKKIKGETTASTGTGTTYTLTLHNPAGDDEEDCSFDVKYSNNVCQEITSNITSSNVTITGSLKNGCANIKTNRVCSGETQIEIKNCKGKTGSWNGHSFTLNDNDNGYYKFNTNPDPKLDNMLEVLDCPNAEINKVYLDGCADYKPVISCNALTTTKTKGSSVAIRPAVTHCTNATKCSYTITGGGTNINHSTKNWVSGSNMEALALVNSATSQTYTLQVANAYNESDECEFTITYTNPEDAPIELTNGSSNVNVACGKSIHAQGSCSNQNVVISCTGAFQKSVCGNGGDPSNPVNVYIGYSNGSEMQQTCSTSCASGSIMRCSLVCRN